MRERTSIEARLEEANGRDHTPYSLHPAPYTLLHALTPCTLHPTPCTLQPALCTLLLPRGVVCGVWGVGCRGPASKHASSNRTAASSPPNDSFPVRGSSVKSMGTSAREGLWLRFKVFSGSLVSSFLDLFPCFTYLGL